MEEQNLTDDFRLLCSKIKDRSLFSSDITQDEVCVIDDSLCEKTSELIFVLPVSDIKFIIDFIEQKNGYSFFASSVQNFFELEASDAIIFFEEKKVDLYKMLNKKVRELGYQELRFALALADYYYYINDDESKKYYQMVFENGLPVKMKGYFDHLNNYLSLIENPLEELNIMLLKDYDLSESELHNLDYLYTLIKKAKLMGKENENYLHILKECELFARQLKSEVENDRKQRNIKNYDSDEERAYCEVLALLLEYYVFIVDMQNFKNYYNALTHAFKYSGCTRYCHARDKFYFSMLSALKSEQPDLEFFDNIKYEKLYIDGEQDIESLLNKKITLTNESGQKYEFEVVSLISNMITISPVINKYGCVGEIMAFVHNEDNINYLSLL